MTEARKVITTIVRASTNTATLAPVTTTRELVVQREEIFETKQLSTPEGVRDALHKVQRHVAESTQAARSLPVLGGTYWPDVAMVANTAHPFQHGIAGGQPVSWYVGSVRPAVANAAAVVAPGIIETAQDAAHGRIALASSLDVTVDVWFFPKPSPQP